MSGSKTKRIDKQDFTKNVIFVAKKAGLTMQVLKYFTLESLLDYINYYFESEKANSKSKDESNSYQGDKGLLSFMEG